MLWSETGTSESVFGLGQTGLLEKSEAQGGSEFLELVEGCLLSGQESNWTGCHSWTGTVEGRSFGSGKEVVVVEEEVEGLA